MSNSYRWAWRLSSCRRVNAGLLSGLGPLLLGAWPSTITSASDEACEVLDRKAITSSGLPFRQALEET